MRLNRSLKMALVFALISGALTSVAKANKTTTSGEALRACKAHMATVHQGELRTKLKKVRKSKGVFEVKMKASENGSHFRATCVVAEDGAIAYTSDRFGTEALAERSRLPN